MKRNLTLLPIAAALLSAGIVGCGSDSNGGAPAATTSGVVTGSYFRHAKVCIDANTNGRCDAAETSTYTDDNGAFTLAGTGAIVAEIGTDATRYDPDAKTATAVTQPMVFRAPSSANGVVSALSTELQALIDDNGGDFAAARKALAKAGLTIDDIDLIEMNEAFAAVVLRFVKDVGADIEKVNVNGGAIAMGHPLGATGGMILGTLVDELERRQKRYGLATLCIGSGMGIATIVERI